jgi:hypothetical protein
MAPRELPGELRVERGEGNHESVTLIAKENP